MIHCLEAQITETAPEVILLLDANRVIHIPQQFMLTYWGYVKNKRDFPRQEEIYRRLSMWEDEIWTELLSNAILSIEGNIYRLEEHGDLFAVPVGEEVEWD